MRGKVQFVRKAEDGSQKGKLQCRCRTIQVQHICRLPASLLVTKIAIQAARARVRSRAPRMWVSGLTGIYRALFGMRGKRGYERSVVRGRNTLGWRFDIPLLPRRRRPLNDEECLPRRV